MRSCSAVHWAIRWRSCSKLKATTRVDGDWSVVVAGWYLSVLSMSLDTRSVILASSGAQHDSDRLRRCSTYIPSQTDIIIIIMK